MTTNKITIIGSIIVIILLISIPTTIEVIKNHQKNQFKVVEEKVIAAAKKCYYDDVCKDDKITLEMLYQNNYLEEVSNPVTKEYYNIKSYVLRSDNNFKFVSIE